MSQLSREHHQLPAMMRFVSDEVREKMREVCREILPRRRRHGATARSTELDQIDHPATASIERLFELCGCDLPDIDCRWYFNSMLSADHLDPHATRVV